MRALSYVLAVSILCLAGAASAKSVSDVPSSGSYAEARETLLKLYWKPVHQPDPGFECQKGDTRCEGRPETVSCAGTGLANCIFRWRKGRVVVDVLTAGETDPHITGVECKKGCK